MSASALVVTIGRAGLDDGVRDRPGVTLLSERGDDSGKLALARSRDHIGRARAVAPHAHVERTFEPE
jgi:hypothetical protein